MSGENRNPFDPGRNPLDPSTVLPQQIDQKKLAETVKTIALYLLIEGEPNDLKEFGEKFKEIIAETQMKVKFKRVYHRTKDEMEKTETIVLFTIIENKVKHIETFLDRLSKLRDAIKIWYVAKSACAIDEELESIG
jgi:hypothetical protein